MHEMKDITNEIRDSIINSEEELMKRREITVNGQQTHMPHDIWTEVQETARYYEVENLQEIIDEYAKWSEKTRIPRKVLKWFMSTTMKASKEGKKHMEQSIKVAKTYGADRKRVFGEDFSFVDKLKFKFMPTSIFYLTNMTLENYKVVENPMFTADTFDINDRFGNSIPGVYVRELVSDTVLGGGSRNDESSQNMTEMKVSKRPFVLIATAMKRKDPKLWIKHIQDGGRRVPITPTISIQ